MATLVFMCKSCGHKWKLISHTTLGPQEKQCPECGSADLKQSFGSYLRNGPLSDPKCGAQLADAPFSC
jgi:putative FmdB family regulatory protein